MSRFPLLSILLAGCSWLAFGQSFEGSLSVGESLQTNASLGQIASNVITGGAGTSTTSTYSLNSGFNIAFRATLNTWVFLGQEVGYAYNRTNLNAAAFDLTGGSQGAQSLGGMAIHQGFYDFLGYATPQGSRIRPFGAVGVHFSNYEPPGSSVQLGQANNKFGINYGGGVKIRLKGPLGVRIDVYQFANGKPFGLPGASGWIRQTEISAGLAVML
jgi:hypothetical protein